jgi:serine/threonine protein kinase
MAACLGAGAHPSLIALHGQIAHHPGGASGLVMALIEARFHTLAAPPSLDSCTRDVYDAGAHFTLDAAIRLASGIASAVRQLHARGILHGDLYAHNILRDAHGQALLGDFGAASFFVPDGGPQALALQRVEVRAFACLVEELLARCHAPTHAQAALDALVDLQWRCAQSAASTRPLFADIVQQLAAISTMAASETCQSVA